MRSDIHHQERKRLDYVWSLVFAWCKPENVLLLRDVDYCSLQVHGSQHSGSSSKKKGRHYPDKHQGSASP